MTGYGKDVVSIDNTTVTVEIRTLNSKQLDIYSRVPPAYREKDLEIRTLLSKKLNQKIR